MNTSRKSESDSLFGHRISLRKTAAVPTEAQKMIQNDEKKSAKRMNKYNAIA